jgi:hypothetical protein
MYSSSDSYKVGFTWVLGFSMAQQNMENKEQNEIFVEVEIDLLTNGLVCYCIFMGYGKWVEQFATTKLYNELKLEFIAIEVSTLF